MMNNTTLRHSKILSSWDMAQLYKEISNRLLVEFSELPTTGIIAGQAVASACFDLLMIGEGPLNDLDWFIHRDTSVNLPSDAINYRRGRSRSAGSPAAIALYQGSLGDVLSFEPFSKPSYNLIFSYQDENTPRLNVIGCEPVGGPLSASMVLNGFDLNVCQMALDVDNEIVVWTDAFQSFLLDLELKITTLSTPVHTAFRMLKKAEEMPFIRFDKHEQLTLLQQARALGAHCERDNDGYLPGQLFNEHTREKYRRFDDVISHYFTIRKLQIMFPMDKESLLALIAKEPAPQFDTIEEKNQHELMRHNECLYIGMTCGFLYKDMIKECFSEDDIAEFYIDSRVFFTLDSLPLEPEKDKQVKLTIDIHSRLNSIRQASISYMMLSDTLLDLHDQLSTLNADEQQRLNTLFEQLHALPSISEERTSLQQMTHELSGFMANAMRYLMHLNIKDSATLTLSDLEKIDWLIMNHPMLFNAFTLSATKSFSMRALSFIAENAMYLDKNGLRWVIGVYESRCIDRNEFNFPAMNSDPEWFSQTVGAVAERFKAKAKRTSFAPVLSEISDFKALLEKHTPQGTQVTELHNEWDFIELGDVENHGLWDQYKDSEQYQIAMLRLVAPNLPPVTVMYYLHIAFRLSIVDNRFDGVELPDPSLMSLELSICQRSGPQGSFVPDELQLIECFNHSQPWLSLPEHVRTSLTPKAIDSFSVRKRFLDNEEFDDIPF